MRLADVQRLEELPGEHGGGADVAGLAGADDVVQGLHRLLDRGGVVPAVDDVEVDVVGSETLQARVDLGHDVLARQATTIGRLAHVPVHLRREDDVVTVGELLEVLAQDLLRIALRVDIGGVEEVDARVEGGLHDGTALVLTDDPVVDPVTGDAEAHRAEALSVVICCSTVLHLVVTLKRRQHHVTS